MQTFVFSDAHLTDTFDKPKFEWLVEKVSLADRVIINGDFWDGYVTTFDRFVTSEWQQLFPLLREKETVYLEGNHDQFNNSDDRVSLFSSQQLRFYEFAWKDNVIHIEHGNRLEPFFNITELPLWKKPILAFYDLIEKYGMIWFGYNFLTFFVDKRFVSYYIKRGVKQLPVNIILIVGHTHWPTFDLDNRFINTGAIKYGYASYVWMDEERIELRLEKYAM